MSWTRGQDCGRREVITEVSCRDKESGANIDLFGSVNGRRHYFCNGMNWENSFETQTIHTHHLFDTTSWNHSTHCHLLFNTGSAFIQERWLIHLGSQIYQIRYLVQQLSLDINGQRLSYKPFFSGEPKGHKERIWTDSHGCWSIWTWKINTNKLFVQNWSLQGYQTTAGKWTYLCRRENDQENGWHRRRECQVEIDRCQCKQLRWCTWL